jgi:hypothetical protein
LERSSSLGGCYVPVSPEKIFLIKTSTVLVCFVLLLLFVSEGHCGIISKKALEAFNVWSNVRLRYELQEGFNVKSYGKPPVVGNEDDTFLLGRLRLGLSGKLSGKILFSAGIQHSEVWGLAIGESRFYKPPFSREHNPYEDDLEPFNTFLLIKNVLSVPVDLKLGRQLIYYGNKRIFGPGKWGNTGRWLWDAAKAHYSFGKHFIDAFYGKTTIHDPDEISLGHNHGFESAGIYAHFKIPGEDAGLVIEPFFMTKDSDGNQFKGETGRSGDIKSYYAGFRMAEQNKKHFDWDITYIRQRGDYAEDKLDAYGYHLQLAYNFPALALKPRIAVDYSYASGDDTPKDGENNTFDGAFGARDKMYGRMNLFHWKNLKDVQLQLTLKPGKNWQVTAACHQFRLAEKADAWYLNPRAYRDPVGQSGDELGKEADLIACWNLPRKHQVQFGAGYFWPDEFAKKQASDDNAAWGFIQWQWQF